MPLAYSSIWQGTVAVAEYKAFNGNIDVVAKDYLAGANAPKTEGKFTFTQQGFNFHFLNRGGWTYLVVADEVFGRAVPTALLDKIAAEWSAKYADRASGAKEGEFNSSFGKQLKQLMEHATLHPEEFSKVASVQKKVDEVKGIMTENIEKVLARGERLELLQDKSDNLLNEAQRFQAGSRTLKRGLWWANCKMKIVVAFAVILLAVVIFLLVCFSGGNCLKGKK